ncbi:MAG: beta-lactamase family protein [Acidimicrobiaceae bacterium]|nr:beta-lactamase family protein [Acidimicrobiaceae bacterium]
MFDRHSGLAERIEEWPVNNCSCFVLNFRSGSVDIVGDQGLLFRWASVSKLASSLGLLSAVTEGVFGLDEKLTNGSIVSDVLAHASGLATDIDLSRDIFNQKLVVPARTKRIYSNIGFELLATEFEIISKIQFKDYLADVLFRVAGMETASVSGDFWPHAGRSGAAAGILGSLNDLIGLATALYSGTPYLDNDLLSRAKTPYLPDLPGILPGFGDMPRNPWGLGLEIRGDKFPHWTSRSNSPATYGHFGASGTFLWIDPSVQLAVGVLTDRDFGPWAQQCWPVLSDFVIESY